MKKLLLLSGFCFQLSTFFGQSTNYDLFKDKSAAYLPDEDRTYFMESISVETQDAQEIIIFNGLAGSLSGNYGSIIQENNPNMKPIVKSDMKRFKSGNTTGSNGHVVCVAGGTICIILFPKFIDADF